MLRNKVKKSFSPSDDDCSSLMPSKKSKIIHRDMKNSSHLVWPLLIGTFWNRLNNPQCPGERRRNFRYSFHWVLNSSKLCEWIAFDWFAIFDLAPLKFRMLIRKCTGDKQRSYANWLKLWEEGGLLVDTMGHDESPRILWNTVKAQSATIDTLWEY